MASRRRRSFIFKSVLFRHSIHAVLERLRTGISPKLQHEVDALLREDRELLKRLAR